jgi:hemolysin D
MMSARSLVPFARDPDRRSREELAFLPAALEIVETPASPLGRSIAFTIMALFALALVWACLSKVDIIATATGKIIPSGRTKVIQPFETGVVRTIDVHDGQVVKAGDRLVELDPTINAADLSHMQSDLVRAELEVARLNAALNDDGGDPLAHFTPPAEASAALLATERKFLADQIAAERNKLAALDQQRIEKEATRATAVATIEKLQASLPILEQRAQIRKQLYDKQIGSKLNYLEMLQAVTEGRHELEVQKTHQQEAEAALAAIIATRAQTVADYHRQLYTELVEAERKASGLRDDVVKAQTRTKLQLLTAPVDGTVQQLAIHTVGGVVTPAEPLLVIVPADSHLEIEANVSNRDIGFIHAGQEAAVKVDTFNFTKYGLLHGVVTSVSQDAISRNKPQEPGADKSKGADDSSSEPSGQELIYAARVSLDRTQMQVDDRLVNLSPGMAVTVEIKTGARRVIEYLLSPLLRYKQSALRER